IQRLRCERLGIDRNEKVPPRDLQPATSVEEHAHVSAGESRRKITSSHFKASLVNIVACDHMEPKLLKCSSDVSCVSLGTRPCAHVHVGRIPDDERDALIGCIGAAHCEKKKQRPCNPVLYHSRKLLSRSAHQRVPSV